MALCDYILCEMCGEKAVYDGDGNVQGRAEYRNVEIMALCTLCSEGHKLVVELKRKAKGGDDG